MPTKAFSSEVATGSLATNATRLREENALKQSSKAGAEHFLSVFSDPERVARYADGPRRYVPGLVDLHRMTGILLAEKAPYSEPRRHPGRSEAIRGPGSIVEFRSPPMDPGAAPLRGLSRMTAWFRG
jgi:hypothetical protein